MTLPHTQLHLLYASWYYHGKFSGFKLHFLFLLLYHSNLGAVRDSLSSFYICEVVIAA